MKQDKLEPVNGRIRRSDDSVINMGDTYKVNGGGDVSQQGIDRRANGKDVLIRVQNKGGQAKDINILISFYEV